MVNVRDGHVREAFAEKGRCPIYLPDYLPVAAAAPPVLRGRVRVVSLLPAATEIVAALGMLDHLVGVSHECDFPPAVHDLPRSPAAPSTAPRCPAPTSIAG